MNDRLEPLTGFGYRFVYALTELLLKFCQLPPHALADRVTLHRKVPVPVLLADMRESQKIERLGLPFSSLITRIRTWSDRGIDRVTALKFGVGFYSGPGLMHGRLLMPLHNADGALVAYCGRSVDQTQPRYRVPRGFAKSEILFNMHRAAATEETSAVIVEGFFDCLKMHQAGIPSVVALMGSAIYESQCRALLGRFRQVVLMLDGDTAGRKASMDIAVMLRPRCSVQVVELPGGTQPDQLSEGEIRDILQPELQRRLAVR